MKPIKIRAPVKEGYTPALTQHERDFKARLQPGTPLQRVTLEAALRTGVRVGTAIWMGKYFPNLIAYQLGENGEPKGICQVIYLAEGMSEPEAITFLQSFDGKGF